MAIFVSVLLFTGLFASVQEPVEARDIPELYEDQLIVDDAEIFNTPQPVKFLQLGQR